MYTLWSRRGWGSTIIEAQCAWYGFEYQSEPVDPWKVPADKARLEAVNPLAQLPTLVLPDGSIMTETVAITFMLADRARAMGRNGGDLLVPQPGELGRDRYLRWQVFLVTNIYPMFTVGDNVANWVGGEVPQKDLLAHVSAYRERMWAVVEANAGSGPWFLGPRMSALDIFIGVMTCWTPRREYFASHCPSLTRIATAIDREPRLAEVWKRNFG